ncbi:hypothetical protein [Acidithiobacillus ferrianus]|uniref:hypothetical protein n=1 Tax=Acidithiobacillus ferrianus TaxID=2678518 RepID=UPI0034E3EB6D
MTLAFLALGGVFFWFFGGPRYVLEGVLGARLRQPVHLAAGPQIYWGRKTVRITVLGLRVGTEARPWFSVNRLIIVLPWSRLLRGQLQIQKVTLDAPTLNGPWRGVSSTGARAFPWPGEMVVHNGALRWPAVAGHTLSVTALNGRVVAQGLSQVAGDWHWRNAGGRWHFAAEMASAPMVLARNMILRVATPAEPALLQVVIPVLQRGSREIVVPTLLVRWQESGQRQARLRVRALRLNMPRRHVILGEGVLAAGRDLTLHIRAADLRWPPLQGHLAYQATIRHLPQLARRWGLTTPPTLASPNALYRLTAAGTLQWDGPHLQWHIAQGRMDGSAWAGQIVGTWKPLAIRVDLHVGRLNLDHYLPAPRTGTGPSALLPALPAHWPVTGSVRVAHLRWGRINARDLVIRSPASGAPH